MEQQGDVPPTDFIQYITRAGDAVAFPPPCPFLASPTSPPPALGRYFSVDRGARGGPVGPCPAPSPLGGPGSTLLALWTHSRIPQAASWELSALLQGPEKEGSRETLGKGSWAGMALDDGPRVPKMGRLPRQSHHGLVPILVLQLPGSLRHEGHLGGPRPSPTCPHSLGMGSPVSETAVTTSARSSPFPAQRHCPEALVQTNWMRAWMRNAVRGQPNLGSSCLGR
jgi:hypothetical protein